MNQTVKPRTFKVDFAAQVKDELMTSEDLISFLKTKMKVNNCKKIAEKEIEYNDLSTSVEISSQPGKIVKRDMKLYLKRYLRSKSLKDFVKVKGDAKDGFEFIYINAVNAEEENEDDKIRK